MDINELGIGAMGLGGRRPLLASKSASTIVTLHLILSMSLWAVGQ
jgi:hypothetical protein